MSLSIIKNNIDNRLQLMLKKARNFPQLWARTLKPAYLGYQDKRWQTSNFGQWRPLDPKYKAWKEAYTGKSKREMPAKGKEGWTTAVKKLGKSSDSYQTNVFTGTLKDSILARNKHYREVLTDKNVTVSTTVPYSSYVNKTRSFKIFSSDFMSKIKAAIRFGVRDN